MSFKSSLRELQLLGLLDDQYTVCPYMMMSAIYCVALGHVPSGDQCLAWVTGAVSKMPIMFHIKDKQ